MDREAPSSPDAADQLHPTISEEIIMSSDGEAPGVFNHPPHIAARIYRNTTNRRKVRNLLP